MNNFSNSFGITIRGHKDIEFVDIPVDTDVELFIDPNLIEASSDSFSAECSSLITSYFDTVFDSCRNNDIGVLKSLISHCREVNDTHLGTSRLFSRGRGASEEILLGIFSR